MKHLFRHYLLYSLILILAISCSPGAIKNSEFKRSSDSQLITNSELRVGTTGDYPPLTSFDTLTNQFQGDEIDMALHLGKYLGKQVIFL
ncbi:hypothetical protein [Pedobacter sp. NJ-S-72]